jgi:predicted aspartyl protease
VEVVAAVHLGEIILGMQVAEAVVVALLSHIKLHMAKYFQVVRNLYSADITFIGIHL